LFSTPFTPFAENPKRIGTFVDVAGVLFVMTTNLVTVSNET
jgi:hypothetical protein